MLTCVVLLLGVAGGVLLALKRPASTPITPVEGFVAAVNQHDLGGALGYIDPTDRALLESTGTVSGLTQLFETGALSRVQVDDLTIDNVKIEGSHAFIELRAKTCEQGSGCNGSARTAFSDFDLPATDLGSGNLDIPCEIVGTNWYLYGAPLPGPSARTACRRPRQPRQHSRARRRAPVPRQRRRLFFATGVAGAGDD